AFVQTNELPDFTDNAPADEDIEHWMLATLRFVQGQDLADKANYDPAWIPAYTRVGFERIQKLRLTVAEAQFASQFNGTRSIAQIARDFARKFHETTAELKFVSVSIGFPSVVREGKIVKDPKHLGKGWIGFNFSRALKRPTRVINDAAMQALGSHIRGRMLFLGLGTGLGAALVWKNNLLPLELGDLPYRDH